MKDLSLVEKAKATKMVGTAEIRLTQAGAALGDRKNTSSFYYQATKLFKKMYKEGRIIIKDQ